MKNLFITALLSLSLSGSGQSLGLSPEAVLSTLVTNRVIAEGQVVLDKLSKDVSLIEEELISYIIEQDDVLRFDNKTIYEGVKVVEHVRAYNAVISSVKLVLYVTDTEDKSGQYDFYQEVMIVRLN
jgi:hypothetical protein